MTPTSLDATSLDPISLDRITLADLLNPVPLSEFTSTWWGRRPLHLTGRPERYAGLVDQASLAAALEAGGARVGRLHSADPDLPLTAGFTETIGVDEIEGSLAAGHTVCISDLSAGSPALARLAGRMASELGAIGAARFNAFLSPPGSGAELHIDARVTTSLQIEGCKEWWFAESPALEWPRSNAQLMPDGTPQWMFPWCGAEPWEQLAVPDRRALRHATLEPGDLLCLPAGTWHAARAVDRSFALNLSFSPPDLPELVRRVLTAATASSARWRGGLPPSPRAPGERGARPDTAVRQALASLLQEAAELLAEEGRRLTPPEEDAGDSRDAAGELTSSEQVWCDLAAHHRG